MLPKLMNKKYHKKPELLAPVNDWKTLNYIKDIPDAIYFGIKEYNMRKNAQNFKREDLTKVVKFCHSQEPPIRVYLCTNILIYSKELEDLKTLIQEAKNAGIDAIIAHDIAAIQLAKSHNLKFHISTQANVSNIISAKFYEELGAERIILARELSLEQINEIKNELNNTEIECFVHGSMCTSISGRCYFSATLEESDAFSANRGNCTQPCRREWRVIDDQNNELIYDGKMFLNAKDLCMIEFIPELFEANIDAFKIEGRMKSPLYVKTVAKCYKEAIHSYYEGTYSEELVHKWKEKVSEVYNRGFHTGFYFKTPTAEDIQLNKRGNISNYRKTYLGKVLSYQDNVKTANIEIDAKNCPIEAGDEIIIEGKDNFVFEHVNTILFHGEKIESIERGEDDAPILLNISLKTKVFPHNKIFKFDKYT
ncbi:MAG: U32 family peptidase [Promethearchaeota archaeon]|nr:MAG: U32 family peptidase [Candidatus Lokiarchaeota archaeon]